MPIPFDDLAEADNSGAVVWLRFIEEEDGRGIRAALFETSDQGDPLAFCFTRVDRRDPSLRHREDAGQVVLTSLVKSLFQSAPRSPTLIFGLADEMPSWMFNWDIRIQIPFCRIRLNETLTNADSEHGGSADANTQQLLWATEQPAEGSGARRILDEIMEWRDPFEPFHRASEGLSEAFDDDRVRAMAAVSGLSTVVSLLSLPQRLKYPPSPSPATSEAVQTSNQKERPSLTLAERLLKVLAAPPSLLRNGLDVQLTWPGELMPFQQDGVRALLGQRPVASGRRYGVGQNPAGHRCPADSPGARGYQVVLGGRPGQPAGSVAA